MFHYVKDQPDVSSEALAALWTIQQYWTIQQGHVTITLNNTTIQQYDNVMLNNTTIQQYNNVIIQQCTLNNTTMTCDNKHKAHNDHTKEER